MSDPGPPTILLVEDHDDFRDIVALQLRLQGFVVQEVESAGAAWEHIHSHQASPPQAIVMDVLLPGIDGQTVARQLRNGVLGAIAIVAFTSLPIEQVDSSPFDAVVAKPDVAKVSAELRRILGASGAPPAPPLEARPPL